LPTKEQSPEGMGHGAGVFDQEEHLEMAET